MQLTCNDAVVIEKIFHASLKDLWKAWTEPQIILKWLGSDPNGKGLNAEMDVREGGHFEITFANSDGDEHTCFGTYKEVKEYSKLSFTWTWKSEPGVESLVTVLFVAIDGRTQMQFEHAKVGTASSHNYLVGWQATFEKLEKILSQNRKMIFREASEQDISAMQIVRNSVTENRLSHPSVIKDSDYLPLIEQKGKGWVCIDNNKIVAFAFVDFVEQNIWALFVMPEFENKGIGKKLHKLMLDWYFSKYEKALWLSTAPNTRAEKFYERHGWIKSGTYGKGEIKFEITKEQWRSHMLSFRKI